MREWESASGGLGTMEASVGVGRWQRIKRVDLKKERKAREMTDRASASGEARVWRSGSAWLASEGNADGK